MYTIFGCGDVGRRIGRLLLEEDCSLCVYVRKQSSLETCQKEGMDGRIVDLDSVPLHEAIQAHRATCFFLVPPQKSGVLDERSRNLVAYFTANNIVPTKVILVSTTAVYGDSAGTWVNENAPLTPQTERGERRLDAENVWRAFCQKYAVPLVILRVPAIYAKSRLPLERIRNGKPIVRKDESGFTNRIHADDLAQICMQIGQSYFPHNVEIFNVSDGCPSTMGEFLQLVAAEYALPPLNEISLAEAKQTYSATLLSYISDSKKIDNRKLLRAIGYTLRYPNVKDGVRFG